MLQHTDKASKQGWAHQNDVYKQMLTGAYRADVCTSSVTQLRDHLSAESGHMPCSCVQGVHATSVSEKLHDTTQYQHKRQREPDQKWTQRD